MAIKVGINGFGRIGRVVFRVLMQRRDEFELCGINLRNAELDYMAYQLKYDSIFGRFDGDIEIGENELIVNGQHIHVFSESDASLIRWADCGAEYIVESTGAFNTMEKAALHKVGGAKKVILTAPSKDDIMPTFVIGVNEDTYTPDMDIVSNASCTTNCLAPLAKSFTRALVLNRRSCPPSIPQQQNRKQLMPEQDVTGEPVVLYSTTSFPPQQGQQKPLVVLFPN